jgi:hypothetical protein
MHDMQIASVQTLAQMLVTDMTGMTGGTLAGMIIADEILGKENPFAKVWANSHLCLNFCLHLLSYISAPLITVSCMTLGSIACVCY